MRKIIEKQLYIIDFSIASLLRRKGKNVSLVIVYIIIIFLLSSVIFLTQSLKHEAKLILANSPEIIVQRTVSGRHDPIPVRYVEELEKIKGIISVRPRLWGYYYDGAFEANYTIIVPEKNQPSPGLIDIGAGVAKLRKLSKGEIIGFSTYDGLPLGFQIRNVLSDTSQLVASDLIAMSELDYRELTGLDKDFATDLVLSVRNSLEYSTIAQKIQKLYPETRTIIKDEILRTYELVFSWRSSIVLLIWGISFLSFLILALDKATGLSAEERKEIGILKAIGWETSDIIHLKLWEGLIISLTSFVIGIIAAYIHIFFTSSSLFVPVLKGWSVLYPQFKLMPHVNISDFVTLFVISVVPYIVSTIIPSWKIAIIDPDTIMR